MEKHFSLSLCSKIFKQLLNSRLDTFLFAYLVKEIELDCDL